MPLLDVLKLTMRFGGLTAVNQVDLAVEQGKIYSVIGPNGAGKTTVFNAITGIYEPTSGEVRFAGHPLARPFTWKVVAACLLIGLATGIGLALFMGNIDKLWRAAIRRNLHDPDRPFRIDNALRDGLGYLRGDLALERQQDGTYKIVNHDASVELGTDDIRSYASDLRDNFELLVDELAWDPTADALEDETLDGNAAIILPSDERRISRFRTPEAAQKKLDQIATVPRKRLAHRVTLVVSFLAGTVLGTAGAYTIWRRARRTPDVISLGGLARTFQNIRLFQNMTVLENVLVGMDRRFARNPLATVLALPSARREERQRAEQACELLDFVGLGKRHNLLAKNLPYGDQRRLEIARALATEPRLLMLDEPAAGMNPAESDQLMELVRRIRERGITVVLIEHHMRLVMNISDRIAVLDHGEKIAEGSPAEVKANPQVIEAYLGKEEVH